MDEEAIIQVDLSIVLNYINNDEFKNYLFSTTDISTALFIIEILNKTITYMLNN